MNDISAGASSAVAMNQSTLREQVTMGIIRMNAQAEQALADMLAQNAKRIEALSGNSSGEGVNLYI
jgi:hypothetical protein